MKFEYKSPVQFVGHHGQTVTATFLTPHPFAENYSVILCNSEPKSIKTSRLKAPSIKVKRWMIVYRCGSIGIHGRDPKKWLSLSITKGEVMAIKEIDIEYFEGEGLDG